MSVLLWTLLSFVGARGGFRSAPIGIGTVISTRRTGTPRLEITLDVETPGGRRFVGVARHVVDPADLSAVEPGATLPVRYRPGTGRVVLATDAAPTELQAARDLVRS